MNLRKANRRARRHGAGVNARIYLRRRARRMVVEWPLIDAARIRQGIIDNITGDGWRPTPHPFFDPGSFEPA